MPNIKKNIIFATEKKSLNPKRFKKSKRNKYFFKTNKIKKNDKKNDAFLPICRIDGVSKNTRARAYAHTQTRRQRKRTKNRFDYR
jgi:hypothetical protein